MSNDGTNQPETEEADLSDQADGGEARPDVDPDVESDPALDDSESTEWSSEGGATEEGPATDTEKD